MEATLAKAETEPSKVTDVVVQQAFGVRAGLEQSGLAEGPPDQVRAIRPGTATAPQACREGTHL